MIRRAVMLIALSVVSLAALAQGQLNLYCSSPNTAWCQGMAVGFERSTGTKVAVIQKATGEMLAQIKAERANPRGDVWWAGPADSYLQAAEEGLLDEYRSPNVAELYPWARRISEMSKNRVAGAYGGIIALGYNTEVMAKRKLPIPKCWNNCGPSSVVPRSGPRRGRTLRLDPGRRCAYSDQSRQPYGGSVRADLVTDGRSVCRTAFGL